MSKDLIKFIVSSVVAFIVCAFFVYSLLVGVARQEEKECMTWAVYQLNYPEFVATDWQQLQCEHYNIRLEN